ncbi:hypothetical protein [Mucilaginibacter sp. 10I4]|uniref:hypothetical protein n=1 Tax=Mucilaginibacter sp. 10I4 TaxID=3048580 RepID=UPI002B22EFAB|nr:hypothetical protein [Mucilaginibacter sp. 10I4]MEB0262889.1 hypothetical protein [Mucilaginibacter sp. 10I4]
MKNKSELIKADVKFHSAENEYLTRSAKHGLYGSTRKDSMGRYTGETHEGNSALCNKNYGISEDGDEYLSIDKIPHEGFNGVCKRCLAIYNKLPA